MLSKASEGLSREKKVTDFCRDGWISWKPPPPSLRATEGQPGLAGVVLLEVPASCSGWGDGDWQHLSVVTPAGSPVPSGGQVLCEWGGGGWPLGVPRRRAARRAEQGIHWCQSLCLSGICLLTVLPPKTEAFILSEQKQQLAKFNDGYGCGDFWDGREANWTHILSTFDVIAFVPGMGVCWHVWGFFRQSSRYLELISGLRTVRPTWSLHSPSVTFLFHDFVKEMCLQDIRQLLEAMGAIPADLVFGGRKKWKEDGTRG